MSSPAISFTVQTNQPSKASATASDVTVVARPQSYVVTRQSTAISMLAAIPDQVHKDKEYLDQIYRVNPQHPRYKEYIKLVERNDQIFTHFFTPLATCVDLLVQYLQDKDVVKKHIELITDRYRRITRKKFNSVDFEGVKDGVDFPTQFAGIRENLVSEIKNQEIDRELKEEVREPRNQDIWQSCNSQPPDEIMSTNHELDRDLPYTTIALAYLLCALEKPEAGLLEIQRWLEREELEDRPDWHEVFRVRAYFHKAGIFSIANRQRQAQEIRRRTIDPLVELLKVSDPATLEAWQRDCRTVSLPERRLVFRIAGHDE